MKLSFSLIVKTRPQGNKQKIVPDLLLCFYTQLLLETNKATFWVNASGWTFFCGWGWVGIYFRWVGMGGHFLWMDESGWYIYRGIFIYIDRGIFWVGGGGWVWVGVVTRLNILWRDCRVMFLFWEYTIKVNHIVPVFDFHSLWKHWKTIWRFDEV